MNVDFSKHEVSSQFNRMYADTWMRIQDDKPFTKIHFQYTDITNYLISDNYSNDWSTDDVEKLCSLVYNLNKAISSL